MGSPISSYEHVSMNTFHEMDIEKLISDLDKLTEDFAFYGKDEKGLGQIMMYLIQHKFRLSEEQKKILERSKDILSSHSRKNEPLTVSKTSQEVKNTMVNTMKLHSGRYSRKDFLPAERKKSRAETMNELAEAQYVLPTHDISERIDFMRTHYHLSSEQEDALLTILESENGNMETFIVSLAELVKSDLLPFDSAKFLITAYAIAKGREEKQLKFQQDFLKLVEPYLLSLLGETDEESENERKFEEFLESKMRKQHKKIT